jgi:hypothetical protein
MWATFPPRISLIAVTTHICQGGFRVAVSWVPRLVPQKARRGTWGTRSSLRDTACLKLLSLRQMWGSGELMSAKSTAAEVTLGRRGSFERCWGLSLRSR